MLNTTTSQAAAVYLVTVGGAYPSLKEFQKRIEQMEYIFLRIADTKIQRDICVQIDRTGTQKNGANLYRGQGILHLEGTLAPQHEVRCVVNIDLACLSGVGYLMAERDLFSGTGGFA